MSNSTLPENLPPWSILLTVVKCVCILLTVGGNGVVILAVITNKMLRRVPDNLLICSLAVTDLLIGAVVMVSDTISPRSIYNCNPDTDGFRWTLLRHIGVTLMRTSLWNLFVISYDRYSFIVHSLQYSSRMIGYKVPLFCLAGWTISIIIHVLYIVPEYYFSVNEHSGIIIYNAILVVFSLGIPLIGIFVAYARILCFTNKTIQQGGISTERRTRLCTTKRNLVLSLLISAFYISWCPYIIYHLLWTFTKNKRCAFLEVTSWLVYINALVNPLIYTVFNSRFRKCIMGVLKCHCLRRKISFGLHLMDLRLSERLSRALTLVDIMETPNVKVIPVKPTNERTDHTIERPAKKMENFADDKSEQSSKF